VYNRCIPNEGKEMEIIKAYAIDPETGEILILAGSEDDAAQVYTEHTIDEETGEYIEVEA
jgi:hypothetical protein